jgi:hypothetical protein
MPTFTCLTIGPSRATLRNMVLKTCGCGRVFTAESWKLLKLLGKVEGLELRNCSCGSTLAVEE